MESKLDLTKPVQTRRGGKVTIFATDLESTYPVLGVEEIDGSKRAMTWTLCGGCPFSGSSYELINVPGKPEPRTISVVYSRSGILVGAYESETRANETREIVHGNVVKFREVL